MSSGVRGLVGGRVASRGHNAKRARRAAMSSPASWQGVNWSSSRPVQPLSGQRGGGGL